MSEPIVLTIRLGTYELPDNRVIPLSVTGCSDSPLVRKYFSSSDPDVYVRLRPRYRWQVLRTVLGRVP